MKETGRGIQRLQHNIVDLFPGIPSCSRQMKPSRWMDVNTHTHAHIHTHTLNNYTLESLDLRLNINEHNKICVDVYAKPPTNTFTYVLPSTCYPKKSINKAPKRMALRLRRICNSDKKFDIRSSEYQNYLIARDYNPNLVKKQFHSICPEI